MAAPTKAFIDPTQISQWMTPTTALSPGEPRIGDGYRAVVRLPVLVLPSNELINPGNTAPILPIPTLNRIPEPPMGRLIVLTFPPVYKERGGLYPRPSEGQTWPRLVPSS